VLRYSTTSYFRGALTQVRTNAAEETSEITRDLAFELLALRQTRRTGKNDDEYGGKKREEKKPAMIDAAQTYINRAQGAAIYIRYVFKYNLHFQPTVRVCEKNVNALGVL